MADRRYAYTFKLPLADFTAQLLQLFYIVTWSSSQKCRPHASIRSLIQKETKLLNSLTISDYISLKELLPVPKRIPVT